MKTRRSRLNAQSLISLNFLQKRVGVYFRECTLYIAHAWRHELINKTRALTTTAWLMTRRTPLSVISTHPATVIIYHISRLTAEGGHTPHTQWWVRVRDRPIGQRREGRTHDCIEKGDECTLLNATNMYICRPHTLYELVQCWIMLTQVGTEGHVSSSSWYGATIRPSWTQGIDTPSTTQLDHLFTSPHIKQCIWWCFITNKYRVSTWIVPISYWSYHCYCISASTTGSQVGMTCERGQTIISIFSNGSDEDLSVVSGDFKAWFQR